MISDKEFTEESLAVLKWLIAIPSISRTSGDEIFCHTIYNTVSEFTYYKVHPEYLNYIPHDDGKNHSFTAFVRRDLLTTQTLVVMCNTDTSSNEVYYRSMTYITEVLQEISAGCPICLDFCNTFVTLS